MAYDTKYDQVRRDIETEKIAERKIQRKSLLDTFLVMGALAAIVFLLRIPPVYPPLPEANGGMDIILGSDLVGMNDTKTGVEAGAPQTQQQAAPPQQQAQKETPQPEPENNDPDAVAVKKQPVIKQPVKQPEQPKTNTNTTAKTSTPPKPNPEPERKSNPGMEFHGMHPGHNGTGGTGTSKGTGNTPGDQGSKNGIPNGGWEKYGTGTEGTGPGFYLAGRGNLSIPKANVNTQVEGWDIVQIVVDKQGNVIEVHGGYRGSTITDPGIIAKDEAAARKAKFTPSENAPDRQIGSIRYVYKLQ